MTKVYNNITHSFINAFNGLRLAVSERNMKIHIYIAAITVILAVIVKLSAVEWAVGPTYHGRCVCGRNIQYRNREFIRQGLPDLRQHHKNCQRPRGRSSTNHGHIRNNCRPVNLHS